MGNIIDIPLFIIDGLCDFIYFRCLNLRTTKSNKNYWPLKFIGIN